MHDQLESDYAATDINRALHEEHKLLNISVLVSICVFLGSAATYAFTGWPFFLALTVVGGIFWLNQCLHSWHSESKAWAKIMDTRLRIIERDADEVRGDVRSLMHERGIYKS